MCSIRIRAWFLLGALFFAPELHAQDPPAGRAPAPLDFLSRTFPEDDPNESTAQLVVRVLLKGCEFSEEEVERVLAAELAVDSSHSESVHEPTWVVVQCAASKVVVEVHDPLSRKIVQRRFDFGSTKAKEARGRLVALAAAELVLASWAELAVLPSPRVEPEGPPPSPAQRSRAKERVKAPERERALLRGTDPGAARAARGADRERAVRGDFVWEPVPRPFSKRLLAFSSLRKFPGHVGTLLGGGVRLGSDSLPLYGWALDALVESGSLGSVHVENWTLGGMLYFAREIQRGVTARAGAGLRAGLVRSWDESPKPHVSAPIFWGWPLLALSCSAHFSGLVLDVASEAGYATLPSSPGSTDSSRGVWLNLQLGFGVEL